MPTKLLLATNSQGKMREYRELFSDVPFDLVLPAVAGINIIVAETGESFEDNARLKATALAVKSNLLTIADDSGLEVDALGGEPGVRSARYAGEDANDLQRVEFLLSKLKGVPWEKRTARFRCVIAIVAPRGNVEICSGDCAGFITFAPFGEHGFGYDPVFYLPEFGKTMAELSAAEKNHISHRGQAARKAAEILKQRFPLVPNTP
ncbi:MAG: XTP/dITP diphosphatase [Dehalococcoidales bacterium]|nr:XTP/dITP diphosphatase [Dehalococcoidales bacterium]